MSPHMVNFLDVLGCKPCRSARSGRGNRVNDAGAKWTETSTLWVGGQLTFLSNQINC